MGRQFCVYLLPMDAESLLNELKRTYGLRILAPTSLRPECVEVSSPFSNYERGKSDMLCFGQYFLAPSAKAEIPLRWVEEQKRWYIDSDAEVIEFSTCDFGSGVLSQGRFYYQIDALSSTKDDIVPKQAEFVAWAERIFRGAKTRLRYDKGLEAYVSSEADLWAKQGGKLLPSHSALSGLNQKIH